MYDWVMYRHLHVQHHNVCTVCILPNTDARHSIHTHATGDGQRQDVRHFRTVSALYGGMEATCAHWTVP